MVNKEFNLSEKIKPYHVFDEVDVKEFIKRRIERNKLIIKLYPHKHGEELAGELNEDLIKDAGKELSK